MGADISRIRFNTLENFAGVQLKQGAVLLDADANLLNDIVDRRMRAAVCDTVGPSAVPSTTPDAFKIDVAGGTLSIGNGRLYVDGLPAENHGAVSDVKEKKRFDPLMAEPGFADPIPYDAQPYFPVPPKLPTAGVHLVYLDVWEREVTYLERPDLVEVALGVETSSRVQTVWQVRVLDSDVGNATCGSPDADLSGWPELIAPSTGRLTTGVFEVAPENDPCELPPTGGYRGLENQTYRIEIHDPGQPGGWYETAVLRFPIDRVKNALGEPAVLRPWLPLKDDAFKPDFSHGRVIARGDQSTRMKPTRSAPAATATARSSGRLTPQTLTRVTARRAPG